MYFVSRRLIPVNFEGSVQLGSRRPIYSKLKYVTQRIVLHVRNHFAYPQLVWLMVLGFGVGGWSQGCAIFMFMSTTLT
jgi:hypothetical protein